MYIDTHCHLIMPGYKHNLDPKILIKDSVTAKVNNIWLAGTNKNDNLANLDLCSKYPNNLRCWVGFHPEEYKDFDLAWLNQILKSQTTISKSQTTHKSQFTNTRREYYTIPTTSSCCPLVGVGEVGIDLNWHDKSTLVAQQEVFEKQIQIANKFGLPVAIHSRDAAEETFEVMSGFKDTCFLWHCYTLDKLFTQRLLNTFTNIYFGFNAIITYKSGAYIMDSLKVIPASRLLFETDAPFLAPRPYKYPYNTPEGVVEVYKYVSDKLEIKLNGLVEQVSDNAKKLQNINE